MTLETQSIDGLGAVTFDAEVFDADDIAAFAELALSAGQMDMMDVVPDTADLMLGAAPAYAPDDAAAEIRRQLEAGAFMPELVAEAEAELGRKLTVDEIMEGILGTTENTLEGQINAAVSATLENPNVILADEDGKHRLRVDGEVVLEMESKGPFGAISARVAAIVKVLIDIVQLVLAFISVRAPTDKKTVGKVAKEVSKDKATTNQLIGAILSILKDIISVVQSTKKKKRKGAIVNLAVDISKALFLVLKYAWSKAWAIFGNLIKVFVSSGYQKIKACASLAASILTWTASAGAVLAASVINLALAVLTLVEDCITLAKT